MSINQEIYIPERARIGRGGSRKLTTQALEDMQARVQQERTVRNTQISAELARRIAVSIHGKDERKTPPRPSGATVIRRTQNSEEGGFHVETSGKNIVKFTGKDRLAEKLILALGANGTPESTIDAIGRCLLGEEEYHTLFTSPENMPILRAQALILAQTTIVALPPNTLPGFESLRLNGRGEVFATKKRPPTEETRTQAEA